MAEHNDLGEKIACRYLSEKGYQILVQNWRWGKGELDIIVKKEAVLVFVEVKTRSTNTFGTPEEAVTEKKQNLLYELAVEYMYRIDHEAEFRFDIIAITMQPELEIKRFEDAFFPTW